MKRFSILMVCLCIGMTALVQAQNDVTSKGEKKNFEFNGFKHLTDSLLQGQFNPGDGTNGGRPSGLVDPPIDIIRPWSHGNGDDVNGGRPGDWTEPILGCPGDGSDDEQMQVKRNSGLKGLKQLTDGLQLHGGDLSGLGDGINGGRPGGWQDPPIDIIRPWSHDGGDDTNGGLGGSFFAPSIGFGDEMDDIDLNAAMPVVEVRYYNLSGQEIHRPEGLTIVVTTYIDGSQTSAKILR